MSNQNEDGIESTSIPFDLDLVSKPIFYCPHVGNMALPDLGAIIADRFGRDQQEALDALMCNDQERMAEAKKKMDAWQAWAEAIPTDESADADE